MKLSFKTKENNKDNKHFKCDNRHLVLKAD